MKCLKIIVFLLLSNILQACDTNSGSDQNTPPPNVNDLVVEAETPVLDGEGNLTVTFKVSDGIGRPYQLDPDNGSLSFSVLKVSSGRNEGDNSFWQTFIFGSQQPAADAKPNFESGGEFVELETGSYQYTFSVDVTNIQDPTVVSPDPATVIDWEPDALHRIAIRYGDVLTDIPVINYVLDWVPSGKNAMLSRSILDVSSCDSCHMGEAPFHGGRSPANRLEPQICTGCHNESNPNSTRRSLAVVVHDVHGNVFDLPEGEETEPEFVGSPFPQDSRNCDTCHKDSTATTANADNWFNHPTSETCGSCHTVRTLGPHSGEIGDEWSRENSSCVGCHGPESSRPVIERHLGRLAAMQAGRDTFKLDIVEARFNDPDIEVDINIQLDGQGIASFDDIAPFIQHGSGYLLVNWNNGQGLEISYTANRIRINMVEECVAQGNGLFLCKKSFPNGETTLKPTANSKLVVTNAEIPLCTDRKATESALIECVSVSSERESAYLLAANPVSASFDVGGGQLAHKTAVGADLASCNDCHKDLTVHLFASAGQAHSAKNFEQCASCHNATRAAFYPGIPADLKYHVHSFHGFGSQRSGDSVYPGNLANCEACHTPAQYNLPNMANARPSLASVATGEVDENDNPIRENKFFSPMLVVCASCHLESRLGDVDPASPSVGDASISHMIRNGAVFAADTAQQATGIEQCASCHAIGQDIGVDSVHDVYSFR